MIIPFILAASMAITPPTVIITEVQIRGDSPNSSHIVLFHQGENELDISGFRLRKRTSSGRESSVRVFPRESRIAANGYFVWANSKNNHHLSSGADVWSTSGIARNNSIALLSPSGEIIDSVAWGDGENQFGAGALPNPVEGQIIKRLSVNGEYLRTGDNLADFFLYPERRSTLPEGRDIRKWSREKEGERYPLAAGVGIALLSSISILILKRSL